MFYGLSALRFIALLRDLPNVLDDIVELLVALLLGRADRALQVLLVVREKERAAGAVLLAEPGAKGEKRGKGRLGKDGTHTSQSVI